MRTTWRIDWVNWPVSSQQVSRRNAQRAAIICAQRRREREAVDRFLTELPATPIPRQRRRRTQQA
jgi:hypothetical protein